MEVALSATGVLPQPLRRGTPLPLSQLVEESQSGARGPNHLLESKIYAKLKSNSQIQAEPPELHFSGFELGKDYTKILKLINISSEVMNIHIIPTQTKHFQTTYTKKYRLVPGLAYTLKVRLCPDEWRYFYDYIRVHCKGEENLLIPVHAYPVIDDLHIPPRIDLSAVPLGQSVCRAIPLRCSCPIDFEFQVYVVQPHEAFSIHPLTGVIPANGEEKITVTFSPFQYETCQVTIQLIISQFNSRPYLCTITGSSAPHLALSELGRKSGHGEAVSAEYKDASPATQVPPRSKTKYRSTKEADKSKTLRDQVGVKPGSKPLLDVCTPAGVAKMLIKDTDKLSFKDLKEAISCGSTVGLQNKQLKEALFVKKVQQNVKEEQANHLRWQVHLGKDPVSELSRRQIAEEREIALHEYMVKRGDVRDEEDFASVQPKLSSSRVLCEAGQAREGAPSFQFYSSFRWELRQRALRLFQQAARKIAIRCRMNLRLTCLKKLSDSMKNSPSAQKVEAETSCDLISPDRIFPFAFPVYSNEDDPQARNDLVPEPVDPVDVTVTTRIPFLKLQVPQHYKLMGYQHVSALDAFNAYIPATLARPLRTGAPDEPVPNEVAAQSPTTAELSACEEEQHDNEEEAACLSFSAPEALLTPFPANPLRIFNPAPGLQTYKPTPKYLESDMEFHLCPLPRYTIPESNKSGRGTPTPNTRKKYPDRKEMIPGLMTWKDFGSITSKCLSNQPALNSDCYPRRSVDYSTDILPLAAPPPLTGPPDDLPPLMDEPCEGSGVQLTPEIIRAEFLSGEALVSNGNLTRGTAARHQKELQMEATYRSELNQMGKRVTTRLKQLGVTDITPGEDCTE
ncbi:cilia- and flagella-associated protein 221 isoform X1 [Sebastes umbrosus]|uniref:cilia- and flagella-associated protein 221 isoform X1 n=1 Tax=Sebastes umbrosus TaxID=72105 RepID=UPI00189EC5F5|nr:cilia- and flagella-associated protein 221 isoform X1 [Sebastes umbrosus]XP_037617595.1 cilia- and flagella-associated protein 221 isoform X1 [Sebastes umbrosus]XP_037617596.1 cilia- and flagella-associated protein 221 isoform X1 [Sebastes umbrosus]